MLLHHIDRDRCYNEIMMCNMYIFHQVYVLGCVMSVVKGVISYLLISKNDEYYYYYYKI